MDLKYWQPQLVLYERSIAYSNLEKYDLALKDINKAIELDVENSSYYYNRLNIYLLKNDLENSILEANKTIEMDRKDPQGFYALAYIMNLNKDYYKSLNYVSIAIEKLLANENYYISDLNGLDRVLLTDLYELRASIYSKLEVFNLMCEDYHLALGVTTDSEVDRVKFENLISNNCKFE